MEKIIVDGKDAIVGRLGSFAAKELLKGRSVVIINSEDALISGNKKVIFDKVKALRAKGGTSRKGPQMPALSDRMLKRMIRGMLPWDRQKGKDAYRRLKCFIGNGDLKVEDLKNVKNMGHVLPKKFVRIKQIVSELKG